MGHWSPSSVQLGADFGTFGCLHPILVGLGPIWHRKILGDNGIRPAKNAHTMVLKCLHHLHGQNWPNAGLTHSELASQFGYMICDRDVARLADHDVGAQSSDNHMPYSDVNSQQIYQSDRTPNDFSCDAISNNAGT